MTNLDGKYIHVSELPPDIQLMKERYRDFWMWLPIIGKLYARRLAKRYDQWCKENNIDGVYGTMRRR